MEEPDSGPRRRKPLPFNRDQMLATTEDGHACTIPFCSNTRFTANYVQRLMSPAGCELFKAG